MNTTNWKRRHLVTAVTLALVLAAPIPLRAEASQVQSYTLPMVSAQALGASGTFVWDFDALIYGGLDHLLPRGALANGDGAFAAGEANDNDFVARAHSAGFGGAITRSYMPFVIHDPQGRGSVKLNVSSKLSANQNKGFKGAVSIGPPPTQTSQSDATVYVRVVPSGSAFMISFADDGRIDGLEYPEPPFSDNDVFLASAQVQCYYDWPDGAAVVKCDWQKSMWVNNQVVEAANGSGSGVSLNATPTLSIRPGVLYLIGLEASSNYDAVAVIDPVLEPHPDNPDVTIEYPNTVANPSPLPLMAGITPEALIAQGIDPQPFIDLGFLGSSPPPPGPPPAPPPPPPAPPPPPPPVSDTTAPFTLASATPDANPLGWNKTAVSVTLSATDNAGGSGAKEVHYSLSGASTGSQTITGNSAIVTIAAEGATTLSYFAVDNAGNRETAKTLTVRVDKTPPTVTGLPTSCTLWPPDHRLVQVASVNVADSTSGASGSPVITATSNEPENGIGDGDLAPDVVISGGNVQLRAERAANGKGRIYTIKAQTTDLAGNTTTQTASCNVPHDMLTAQP